MVDALRHCPFPLVRGPGDMATDPIRNVAGTGTAGWWGMSCVTVSSFRRTSHSPIAMPKVEFKSLDTGCQEIERISNGFIVTALATVRFSVAIRALFRKVSVAFVTHAPTLNGLRLFLVDRLNRGTWIALTKGATMRRIQARRSKDHSWSALAHFPVGHVHHERREP